MAEANEHHGDLPPARHTLSIHSDREALELDHAQANGFPPLTTVVTNQSTPRALRWWRRHISLGVPHVKCRDHLGKNRGGGDKLLLAWDIMTWLIFYLANERTFLGYLRTGQAFAMLGVIIAQVMRLQHSITPDPVLGYFAVSVPLSSACHASAIAVSLLGAIRFFRYQKEMARGYAVCGGWEIKTVGTLATMVCLSPVILTAFALLTLLGNIIYDLPCTSYHNRKGIIPNFHAEETPSVTLTRPPA